MDKYKAPIICKFCRRLNFDYNHLPSDCNRCFRCREIGHHSEQCPTFLIKPRPQKLLSTSSARNEKLINNSKLLKKDEPVVLNLTCVLDFSQKPVPAYVVIIKPNKNRKKNKVSPTDLVYSAKIRQLEICMSQKSFSCFVRSDLSEDSVELDDVKVDLIHILKDRLVIGFDLRPQLKLLGIEGYIAQQNRLDFAEKFKDKNKKPNILESLINNLIR